MLVFRSFQNVKVSQNERVAIDTIMFEVDYNMM
jgi:hypothetical protein